MIQHEKLNYKNFLEHTKSNIELNEHIRNVFKQHDKNPLNIPVYSTDTIMAQYLHLDEFINMGAKAIEMESATFFGCMSLIKKQAAAFLRSSLKLLQNSETFYMACIWIKIQKIHFL